jgi:hypothetical protein
MRFLYDGRDTEYCSSSQDLHIDVSSTTSYSGKMMTLYQ